MYERPTVVKSDDLAEGVFMASGDGSACYTTTANIHQVPETGRGDYRIQVDGHHDTSSGDKHCNDWQQLVISFNNPVTYKSSNGQLVSGDNSTTLTIQYSYHQNSIDNIGLGDLCVESEPGLAITNVYITDAGHQFGNTSY